MDGLIDAVYAAAAEPELWPATLDRLSAIVGALGFVVMYQHSPNGIITSASLCEANEEYMAGNWWEVDARNNRSRGLKIHDNTVVLDRDIITAEEKRTEPFFQDFSLRYGLGEFAGYVGPEQSSGRVSVGAFRAESDGGYGAAEVELLLRIGPHVARAYTLTKILTQATNAADNAAAILQHARIGMVTLDGRGHVRQINPAAESLLPGYLRLDTDRHLRAVAPTERERLDRRIASALSETADGATDVMLLRGLHGGRPLAIEAIPLRGGAARIGSFASKQRGVLLILRDLLAEPRRSIEPQLQQVGLTPAEARVAMLIGRGRSPNDVAEELKLSGNTVRTQLKSIFQKLGINRQSELAILTTRLDGLVG